MADPLYAADRILALGQRLDIGSWGINYPSNIITDNIIGASDGAGSVYIGLGAFSTTGSIGIEGKGLAKFFIHAVSSLNMGSNSINGAKDFEMGDSFASRSSLTSSALNTVNLTNTSGDYLVTLGAQSSVLNTNTNGSVINYSGTANGSLTVDIKRNDSSLQAVSASAKAIYFDNSNADLIIKNTGATITGGIFINNAKSFSLRGNNILNGSINLGNNPNLVMSIGTATLSGFLSGSSSATSVTFGDASQIIQIEKGGALGIGTTVSSTAVSIIGSGKIILSNNSAQISLLSSTLSSSIDGSSALSSITSWIDIAANQSVIVNADIGATAPIGSIRLYGGSTLDLATYNKSINVASTSGATGIIASANNAKLILGDSSVNASIVNASATTSFAIDVVGNNRLLKSITDMVTPAINLTIKQNAALSLNNNSVTVKQVTMDQDSTLNIEQGSLNGNIVASGNGFGTVNFTSSGVFSRTIGTALSKVSQVNINSGAAITLGISNTINATNIVIGDGSSLSAKISQLVGDISLAGSSNLTLQTRGTFNNKINGVQDEGSGNLNILAGQAVTTKQNIGETYKLASVVLGNNATLNLKTNNNSLASNNLTLNSGSVLNIGSGAVNSDITSSADGLGVVNFKSGGTFSKNIGTNLSKVSAVNIDSDQTLDLGSLGDIKATKISLGKNSVLSAKAGKLVGNVSLADSSSLNLNVGELDAKVDGSIAEGSGTLYINENQAVTTKQNIGETYKLNSVELAEGTTLNLNTNNNSLASNNLTLNSGSVLNIGSATVDSDITASEDGVGVVNFKSSGTFLKNIGTALSRVFAVSMASGAEIALGESSSINALTIAISDNSSVSGATDQITGNVSIDNSSSLTLDGGTTTGEIDGLENLENGVGFLYINTDKTVTTANDIGKTNKLSVVELLQDSTLNLDTNGNSLDAGSLILNNGATLNIGSGAVNSNISASANSVGVINFKDDYDLNKHIGSTEVKIAELKISSGKTLSATNSDLHIDQIKLEQGANLTIKSGVNIDGDVILGDNANLNIQDTFGFTGNVKSSAVSTLSLDRLSFNSFFGVPLSSSASGNINIEASQVLVNFGIGEANNPINQFNIADGSNASVNSQINALNTNVSGTLNLTNSGGNSINGNLNVASSGVLNLYDQSHNVAGDLNLADGSTLKLTISSDNQAGSIVASGLAMIGANTNIRLTIDQTVLSNIKSGVNYTIVSGASGSDISQISENNILVLDNLNVSNLRFSTKISSDALILNIAQRQEVLLGSTDGQKNLYRELINLENAEGNLLALNQLLTNEENAGSVTKILESVSPQVDNSINKIPFENVYNAIDQASKRIGALRGISSGSEMAQKSVWVQTFGARIYQGNSATSSGYKANTQGILMGFDKEVEDNLIIGTSLSYINSSLDSISKNQRTKLESYQLNLYGAYDFSEYFVNAMIGFAHNEYSSVRNISIFNLNANANYAGQTYVSRAEIGKNLKLVNGYVLTPLVAVTAAKNYVDNYQEGGAGDLNLRIKNNSTSLFETRLGANISKLMQLNTKQQIMPNFGISYGYDFAGSKQKVRANFVGQDLGFSAKSSSIPQGSLRFSLGTQLYCADSFNVQLNYEYDYRNNFHAHSAGVKGKYQF